LIDLTRLEVIKSVNHLACRVIWQGCMSC